MPDFHAHTDGKKFLNPVPTEMMKGKDFFKALRDYWNKPKNHQPSRVPGPFPVDYEKLAQTPPGELRITWIGHSSILIDIDGFRILTDPVWYQRASPFSRMGPKRFFAAPIPLNRLPAIDLILLSHDHYDHLDKQTMITLTSKNIPVLCFLKVGARLLNWGIPSHLVTEIDWGQTFQPANGPLITGLPSRHFSGRWIGDQFTTLWGSFAIRGRHHNIYFGADSGYYEGFKTIGEQFGPFHLTMMDTGAYNELWENIHMGPENAVKATLDLKGQLLMPIHWGTFSLANHPWTEPVERAIIAAGQQGLPLFLPAPGETRTVTGEYNSEWWKKFED